MSGGPPHHPHNRQNPASNSAWNHLQVPNFFPRQPLHAHMSTDPTAAALLHQVQVQPSWHVPAADPLMKVPSSLQSAHHHLFNLEQMVAERQQQHHHHHVFPRDLSSPRNGSGVQQNGDDVPVAMPPISLSVRDTNKINSMSASALEINVKSTSPSLKCLSPGLSVAAMSAMQQQASPKSTASGRRTATPPMTISTQQILQQQRLVAKRGVDSILERLNPPTGNSQSPHPLSLPQTHMVSDHVAAAFEKPTTTTVMPLPSSTCGGSTLPSSPIDTLQASINAVAMGVGFTGGNSGSGSQHDDNSNSSSALLNVPTPTNAREDDVVSPYSNDDNSLDSNKSRRKRKPSKTMRVSKDILPATVPPPSSSPVGSDLLLKQTADTATIPKLIESQQPTETLVPTTATSMMHLSTLTMHVTTTPASPAAIQTTATDPRDNSVDNNIPRPDIPLENKISERRKSPTSPLRKTSRRKASSDSETIANIAAMVQEMQPKEETPTKASLKLPVEPENTLQGCDSTLPIVSSNEKSTEAPFGEVENKLEEMFAGLEDVSLSKPPGASLDVITNFSKMGFDNTKDLLKLESNDLLSSTPDGDTSLRRVTRSTPLDIPLDSGSEQNMSTSTPSSCRRRKKMVRKSPKRSKSPSHHVTSKSTSKGTKKNNKFGATSLTSSFASKLSSDMKDVVANAYDSGSNASSSKSRGPFIQIKGPRDSPYSVSIVNSNNNTDGDEHQASGGSGGGFGGKTSAKNKFHDDSEYRQRVRVRGLHCSTLSNKYDAETRDATWICAFCKRGPHAAPSAAATATEMEKFPPPGDLFGPYVITTACAEYQRRLDDPYDKQFKSKKVCRSLDAIASTSKANVGRGSRSAKRKLSESHAGIGAMMSPTSSSGTLTDDASTVTCEQSIMLGITVMPDTDTIHTPNKTFGSRTSSNNTTSPAAPTICYEVWAHEDCIVWSAGVHLGGGGARIVGLEAAVWASSGVTCATCGLRGANVCCMRRGCTRAQHYACARVSGWTLREDDYAACCTEHAGLTPRGTPVAVAAAPLHNGDAVGLC